MEAETDGMKSAALWRGSPGAKILLSHIPTNPTRRLGSLSHHSKDPHGCPPPPPRHNPHPPKKCSSVAQADRAPWPTHVTFLPTYVYVRTLVLMEVDDLGFHRPAKIRGTRGEQTWKDTAPLLLCRGRVGGFIESCGLCCRSTVQNLI